MIYFDQGGAVDADPPVAVLAVNNQQQGPTVVPLPPKTASNERKSSGSGSRLQPQRPAPSRQQSPAGKINEALDVIDRVRRMIR